MAYYFESTHIPLAGVGGGIGGGGEGRKEEAMSAFQALRCHKGQDCDRCVWELV